MKTHTMHQFYDVHIFFMDYIMMSIKVDFRLSFWQEKEHEWENDHTVL